MLPNKSIQMVLDRKATLRHLSGHSIAFLPGVPIGVPPQLVKSATSLGAKVHEGPQLDFSEDEVNTRRNSGPIDPEERLEEITAVIKVMITRNDRSEWAGTGTPKVDRISELLGYKVQKPEVLSAFAAARYTPEEIIESNET